MCVHHTDITGPSCKTPYGHNRGRRQQHYTAVPAAFVRSNNRRQQRRRWRRRASRARGVCANTRFISQIARTKANLNVEWLKQFEGGVASACAVAAPPLGLSSASAPRSASSAPPPLRLHCASCLLLASLAPLPSASVAVARRAAARDTSSPSRICWEYRSCSSELAPHACVGGDIHGGRFVFRVLDQPEIRVRST